MNFRERGFTVGDLLIVSLIFLISYFTFIKLSEENNKKDISILQSLEILKK